MEKKTPEKLAQKREEQERLLKKVKKDLEVMNVRLLFAVDKEAECATGLVVEGETLKRLQTISRVCGLAASALAMLREIRPDEEENK